LPRGSSFTPTLPRRARSPSAAAGSRALEPQDPDQVLFHGFVGGLDDPPGLPAVDETGHLIGEITLGDIERATARGENITVIFINNAIFGMTGGQMAPTTLPGQKTTSSPLGRDVEQMGFPIRMAEILSTLDGVGYVVRRSLHDPKNIRLSKKAIRFAFEAQLRGLGFSMVELLSTCPTNWGMTALEALRWVEERMVPVYPLEDYKVSPSLAEIKVKS